MTIRTSLTFGLATLALLAGALLSAAPALAARPYESQLTGFTTPQVLTTDAADSVWVVEPAESAPRPASQLWVYKFDASGSPVSKTKIIWCGVGTTGLGCSGQVSSLAVDPSEVLTMIVAEQGSGIAYSRIQAFNSLGTRLTKGEFETYPTVNSNWPFYVASVESTANPQDDLYVTRPDRLLKIHSLTGAGEAFSAAGTPGITNISSDGFELLGTPSSSFRFAGNLTVDRQGNIYVIESFRNVIDEFHPDGTFVHEFTGGSLPAGEFDGPLSAVAVDPMTGNLLVVAGDAIDEFTSSGIYLGQITGTGSASPFVSLSTGSEYHFFASIAFNSVGDLYVLDRGAGAVDVFGPDTSAPVLPSINYAPVADLTLNSVTVGGTVDPDGIPVESCQIEYGTDSSYDLGSLPCAPDPASSPPTSSFTTSTPVSTDIGGLTAHTTYRYRISVTTANGTRVGPQRTFTTLSPNPPRIDATSVTEVTPTSALLHAQVNPGFGVTEYRFEYGSDTSYAGSALFTPLQGSDGADHSATAKVTGLIPGKVYHFRADAVNFSGITDGPDKTFTTPGFPRIPSTSVTQVSQATATITAVIEPNLSSTTYHLEYGPTLSYGTSTVESAPIGSDSAAHTITTSLTGLSSGTTYHFRVVATNEAGTDDSADGVFTTTTAGSSPPPINCRAGFAARHDKCVKRKHKKRKHKRGHRHRSPRRSDSSARLS